MKTDDKFYKEPQQELFSEGGSVTKYENGAVASSNVYDVSSVEQFVSKLMSEIKAPYVRAGHTTLGNRNNISVYLTLSLDRREKWKKGMLENSNYAKFRIDPNGIIEKISGNLPNFKRGLATSEQNVIEKINSFIQSPEKYEEGANIEIQTPYHPASEVCESLNTLVPTSMASELRVFNDGLKAFIQNKYNMSVAEFVAMKLHYNSVDDLCYDPKPDEFGKKIIRFAEEQIDAIATAIYSHEERGDAIIIADQTGVGKGRTAAGIIRYAILDKGVVPFFFTEKKHLINDIYRDLIDIGFDAGIIEKKLTKGTLDKKDWSENEIIDFIIEDIESTNDVIVDYTFPENFNIDWLKKYKSMTDDTIMGDKKKGLFTYQQIDDIMQELVDLYTTKIVSEGREVIDYIEVPQHIIKQQEDIAKKEGKIRVKPFFPNNKEIVDKNGNIIYDKLKDSEIKKILGYKRGIKPGTKKEGWVYDYDQNMDNIVLPKEFKLFVVPYSQVQIMEEDVGSSTRIAPKIRFFQKYATNSVIILDEAHTASGGKPESPSNTFKVLTDLIGRSAMTTYLSATYAKRAINMPLYAIATSMKESGLSNAEMIMTFQEGDTALQEAVSAELTRNGQLLRREKQIQGKSDYYYVYDGIDDIGTQQRLRMDSVAALFREVRIFQDDVHSIIKEYRKKRPSKDDFTPPRLVGSKEEIEKHRSIRALTFQMFNFFLLGLKIKQTVTYTLEKLNNGIKPVITVANTLESALKNMPKSFMTNDEKDRYKVGDTINNDFNLYIAYLLFYTMRWKKMVEVVDDDGEKILQPKIIYVLDDNENELSDIIKNSLLSRYTDLLSRILATPTGVSVAPIDEIKRRIKEKGFSINEITGRQLEVVFDGDNYSKGIISKREIKDTTTLVRDFNENKVDSLIINQSGAVGISMHARPVGRATIVYPVAKQEIEINGQKVIEESGWPTSLENEKEVKKRAMIVTQMELDINKEVQKLGRINRTGQVYPPEFTYIISTIPSESRLTALMERKLRSLSANVSSNQEQSAYLFESDDFFSKIAIIPFNETMKDLGINIQAPEGEQGVQFIKDYTKMLYFSDYDLQRNFYDTFSRRLNEEIARLKKDGLFTGKITKKDYKAKTIEKYPFYIGNEKARTSFGRHSFLEKAAIVEYVSKNTDRDVDSTIVSKSNLAQEDGTTIPYVKLEQYKSQAKKDLESFISKKKSVVKENEKRLIELIKGKQELKKQKEEEYKKYGNVSEILSVEKRLVEIDDKLGELKVAVADAMENNPGKLVELSSEMSTLKEEQKTLREKLDSFGEYKSIKSEAKVIEREVSQLDKDIDSLEKDITNYQEEEKKYTEFLKDIAVQVDRIGSVVTLTKYEEVESYETETGEVSLEVQKFIYKDVSSYKAVITGVRFPHYQFNIIPSNVDFSFMSVTESTTIPYSQIFPKITEEQASKGKKSVYEIKQEYPDYKEKITIKEKDGTKTETNIWNNIAKETYTGVDKTKWFVAGSVLKSFTLSKQNGLNGEILKFTMQNNIDRIGIEITNKVDKSNPNKSTYTELDRRYDPDTGYDYLVYFDGNMFNIENLMIDYVYYYLFTRLYELNRTRDTNLDYFDFNVNDDTCFVFQISSRFGITAVVLRPSYYLLRESIDLFEKIETEYQTNITQLDKQELISNTEVELVTTSMLYANIYASMLNNLGVDIDESNFEISDKSDMFPNVTPITLPKSKKDKPKIKAYGQDIFYTIFPIDLAQIQVEISVNGGIEYAHKLKMSMDNFLELSKNLEERNQKPTFSISNKFFATQKHLYLLEQFVDKMTDTQDTGNEIDFITPAEGEKEKEISIMIDNLVKILA